MDDQFPRPRILPLPPPLVVDLPPEVPEDPEVVAEEVIAEIEEAIAEVNRLSDDKSYQLIALLVPSDCDLDALAEAAESHRLEPVPGAIEWHGEPPAETEVMERAIARWQGEIKSPTNICDCGMLPATTCARECLWAGESDPNADY